MEHLLTGLPDFMARLCHCPALTIQRLPRTLRLGFKDFTITSTYLHDLSSDYLSNLVSQHFSFQLFACILLFNSLRLYRAQGFFFTLLTDVKCKLFFFCRPPFVKPPQQRTVTFLALFFFNMNVKLARMPFPLADRILCY